MGPWPLFYYHTSLSSGSKCGISFMDVGPETFKLLNKMWKPNKHNSKSYGPLAPILIRDISFSKRHTPRVMGPWPLFYYHTSFSSGTTCGISFMEVGPKTFKLLNKMRKTNKGRNSKNYGPLSPTLLPHLQFFRDQVWYKFHGWMSRNISSIKQNLNIIVKT